MVDVAPANRLILKNRRTRVWEMRLGAGETYPFHRHHFPYLSIILEGANLVLVSEDGRSEPIEAKAGEVLWREPPDDHAVRNVGKTRFVNRLVEFLPYGGAPPSAAGARRRRGA